MRFSPIRISLELARRSPEHLKQDLFEQGYVKNSGPDWPCQLLTENVASGRAVDHTNMHCPNMWPYKQESPKRNVFTRVQLVP